MKQLLLATVACLVLSVPGAMAQSGGNANSSSTQMQNQAGKSQTAGQASQTQEQNGQQQAQTVQPSSLSKSEIQQVQMNLNKAGFSAKSVDGVWGEDTVEALRNFQQVKHLPGNGQLNQQTLSALGVNINNQSSASNSSQQNAQPSGNSSAQTGSTGQSQTTGSANGSPNASSQGSASSGQNGSAAHK